MHLTAALALASALLAGTAPMAGAPAPPAAPGTTAVGSRALGTAAPGTAVPGAAAGVARTWAAPIAPPRILRPFAPPEHDWLPGHRGLDLATVLGQPVRAAGDGIIAQAGPIAGRGVVVVDHGAVRTTYEPVEASVRLGQRVVLGQVIGVIAAGTGHCGDGSCLHLGLRRGSEYLDPALLLGRRRAVLVPW